jgi:hypothetical protein
MSPNQFTVKGISRLERNELSAPSKALAWELSETRNRDTGGKDIAAYGIYRKRQVEGAVVNGKR